MGNPGSEKVIGRRVVAAFLDLVPLMFLAAAFSDRSTEAGFQIYLSGLRLVLVAVVSLGYYFVTESLTGTSPGKFLLGLRVVDRDGSRPGSGAVAVRTILRPIDGFPIFYLVGFIAALVSSDDQRLGDMAAKTYVVRSDPASRPNPVVLGLAVLVVVAVGAAGFALGSDGSESVGSFDYRSDVVPWVDETIDMAFRPMSAQALEARFPPGLATPEELASAMEGLTEYSGPLEGDYRVTDHEVIKATPIRGLNGTFDVVEIRLRADFQNGPGEVAVVVAAVDGTLRLIRWDVVLDES